VLGTIIGDIVGSAYEFSGHKSKNFTPLFHPKSRFTDDTVCTVGIAQALLDNADPATTLIAWCDRYAENGGWGRAFAQWFTASKPEPYGSWGNGGAMRVSPVGFLATSEEAVIAMSDAVTCITHNHPEAMASAQAVALAVYWAKRRVEAGEIQRRLVARFDYPLHLTPDDIRPGYKRTERASESVPQAISCALHAAHYEDAIRNAVSLGGDSDTIAAIAGGIAEAFFGIPENIKIEAWAYLPTDIRELTMRFYMRVTPSMPTPSSTLER
jgi:ADP-ribosyl-[dinitrogen reductase] hydrolase